MTRRARAATRPRSAGSPLMLVDLLNAPELAVLDVLQHAVHVARVALIAQHPHLLGDERGQMHLDGDPIAQSAAEIIDRAFDLSVALQRYRRAIANATDLRDDHFPF